MRASIYIVCLSFLICAYTPNSFASIINHGYLPNYQDLQELSSSKATITEVKSRIGSPLIEHKMGDNIVWSYMSEKIKRTGFSPNKRLKGSLVVSLFFDDTNQELIYFTVHSIKGKKDISNLKQSFRQGFILPKNKKFYPIWKEFKALPFLKQPRAKVNTLEEDVLQIKL